MQTIPIINSFNSILLNENSKPLIICDIDNTFLRPINGPNFYKKRMEIFTKNFGNGFAIFSNKEMEINIHNSLMYSLGIGDVKQTDPEGFSNLLNRIKELNGKLVFLTARNIVSHNKTIEDFKKVGLENPEIYEIHYTDNKITKGRYLEMFNEIMNGFDQIIFIDDLTDFLKSVYEIHPFIQCYQFLYHDE